MYQQVGKSGFEPGSAMAHGRRPFRFSGNRNRDRIPAALRPGCGARLFWRQFVRPALQLEGLPQAVTYCVQHMISGVMTHGGEWIHRPAQRTNEFMAGDVPIGRQIRFRDQLISTLSPWLPLDHASCFPAGPVAPYFIFTFFSHN